jgi:hypothetical protein
LTVDVKSQEPAKDTVNSEDELSPHHRLSQQAASVKSNDKSTRFSSLSHFSKAVARTISERHEKRGDDTEEEEEEEGDYMFEPRSDSRKIDAAPVKSGKDQFDPKSKMMGSPLLSMPSFFPHPIFTTVSPTSSNSWQPMNVPSSNNVNPSTTGPRIPYCTSEGQLLDLLSPMIAFQQRPRNSHEKSGSTWPTPLISPDSIFDFRASAIDLQRKINETSAIQMPIPL